MPASDRRAVLRLPLSIARWEVALVALPVIVGGEPIEGFLLVVDESSGTVREAGPLMPGDSLWPSLREALFSPSQFANAARPRALVCRDPALAQRLREAVEGLDIPVELVAQTSMADEAAASLSRHFTTPPPAPGITVELPRWTAALRGLCTLQPWKKLPDSVVFRFESESPELSRAVGIVLGLAGEQEGVVLYESEDDYACFVGQLGSPDFAEFAQLRTLCAFLDPERDFDKQERAACKAAGLALPGRRMPRVMGVRGQSAASLSEAEQRVLLAAVQAIQSLCAAKLDQMAEHPCEKEVPTCLGAVRVRSTPPPRALLDVDHALSLGMVRNAAGEERMALVIKARKADAKKIASRLEEADSARAERTSDGRTRLSLWTGETDQGTVIYEPLDARTLADLARSSQLWVCVSAGGPTRPHVDPREFVFSRSVALKTEDLTPSAPPSKKRRHDPVFNQPRSKWPKAADTLLQFTRGALDEEIASRTPHERLTALEMAAMVWNAVVWEDFGREPEALEGLLRVARGSPLSPRVAEKMAEMAQHKREHFGGDPRLFENVNVKTRKGSPVVTVEAHLPPGYALGER